MPPRAALTLAQLLPGLLPREQAAHRLPCPTKYQEYPFLRNATARAKRPSTVAQKQLVDGGIRRPHGLRGEGEVAFGLALSTGARHEMSEMARGHLCQDLGAGDGPSIRGTLQGFLPDVIGTPGVGYAGLAAGAGWMRGVRGCVRAIRGSQPVDGRVLGCRLFTGTSVDMAGALAWATWRAV
jgi:hypothetical protein